MTKDANPMVSLRKKPKQARANALIDAVLEAAIQVLIQEGAARFTTARVADRAGVSVGSLYQYFPNKAAILFRLQSDEWRHTTDLLREILEDSQKPPLERLRKLVHAFIQSECEEVEIRGALDDAAPLYRDAPEAKEAMAKGDVILRRFIQKLLPGATAAKRKVAGNLIIETLTTVGKRFSESHPTPAQIKVYAEAMADMLSAYIKTFGHK